MADGAAQVVEEHPPRELSASVAACEYFELAELAEWFSRLPDRSPAVSDSTLLSEHLSLTWEDQIGIALQQKLLAAPDDFEPIYAA